MEGYFRAWAEFYKKNSSIKADPYSVRADLEERVVVRVAGSEPDTQESGWRMTDKVKDSSGVPRP